MSKFFIADPVHIHERNFGSLFSYLTEAKANVIINNDRKELMSAFGDYYSVREALSEIKNELETLTDDELYSYQVLQVNIFKTSRAETLSLAITFEEIRAKKLPTSDRELFNLLIANCKDVLLWNMAAAVDWINFWSLKLKRHNPKFVLVFSGSLTYARTLLELTRTHICRTFVLESFFTGNDNYIEEKFEPIANNSNLKFNAYYRSLEPSITPDEFDRERNKAINKVLSAKNKNVTQPEPNKKKIFNNSKPTILITGQVLNDFSVLEHRGVGINTLAFYKVLIEQILYRTDLNVIFKAHPWERKKKNIKSPLTLDELCTHFCTSPYETSDNDRLIFIEDYNIKSLFKQVDYVAGINSQALIEAAFDGYQPIQFGDAFFGYKGFTSDYAIDQIYQFIDDLNAGKIPSYLSLDNHKNFESFLVRALQYSLVSAFPSGKLQLKKIFSVNAAVPILKGIAPAVGAVSNEKPAAAAAPKPSAGPAAPITASIKPPQPAEKITPKKQPAKLATDKSTSQKKWNKFFRTPKKFFSDSKNKRIRWLHVLIPSGLSFTEK